MKTNLPNNQQKASNPNTSAWVSASAGTGKTKILVDRLLRLLLSGVSIDNILCITYSRAAAQEMINRLMSILANWSIIEEKELIKNIQDIANETPTEDQLYLAKELFAKIINHPRELKIQTIHSFCNNLLSRFPLEAKVPPHFVVIEDESSKKLKNQAIETIISEQIEDSKHNLQIQSILSNLSKNISQHSFEKIITNILNYSEKLELISLKYNVNLSMDFLKQEIYSYLQADINLSSEDIIKNYFDSFNYNELIDVIKIFQNKGIFLSKLDINNLLDFIKKPNIEKIEKFDVWKKFFLTDKETPKQKLLSKETIKLLDGKEDLILSTIQNITNNLLQVIEKIKASTSSEINFAIMQIALIIYKKYQELKYDNGYLDYTDLIMKTYELLSNNAMAPWIMYKLDQKIDHVLVDESQDTSPMQWEIIKQLIEEYYSGESSKSDTNRTVFVVGDIKQSIYSFQGADPYSFSRTREYLKKRMEEANKPFLQIAMNTSFRSAKGIIDVVNNISKNIFDVNNQPYLSEEINHNVFHENKPFLAEVWPLIYVDKKENNNTDKFKNLAQAIVKKIETLNVEQGIHYGDILILYRKRQNNVTLDYIVKLLKDKNIPVLGIDKINLKNNIAIKDIIALAKFLSQNKDSFALSCLLKSPIFNLVDADIFNIIYYNQNTDAFTNLKYTHKDIYEKLIDWVNMVDYKNTFDLFFHILYKDTFLGEANITKFVKRLGLDIIDPISEFMNLIADFQSKNEDNLQSFIKFLENYDGEIKREVSNNKDSINLMSIHGSKGLQSKAVFLLNDLDNKSPKKDILFNGDINKPLLLISPKKEIKSQTIKNLEDFHSKLELEESKRLLYVAVTRAEEQLYIASISNNSDIEDKEKDSYLWYKAIIQNIDNILKEEEDSFFTKDLGFVSNKVFKTKKIETIVSKEDKKLNILIPNWVYNNAPVEPTPTKPITPSKLIFEETYFNSPLDFINLKQTPLVVNKGEIMHKILEQINYISFEDYENFINNFLNQQQISIEDKTDIKKNVNNIITNKEFSFLFNKNSLNEVSLSGLVKENNNLQLISARVDKLIILDKEIIIIDYKYSKKKTIIPKEYQRQINLYKKLLQDIYKNYKVRGFILFSQTPSLVEVL